MEDKVTFGAWLKRRRRSLDLTQQALADCAGCSLVTIRKFEADERRPSRQLAELMAGCLAVPAGEREAFIAFARQPEDGPAPAPLPTPLEATPPAAPLPAPQTAPALAWTPEPPIVLPSPLTGIIGRDREVEAVGDLLLQPTARLVTLTGPGGTGKTRLAIAVARHLAEVRPDAFPDGFYFVDLASLFDPALFVPALVEALGMVSTPGEPLAVLRSYLRSKRLLLVLDNFEQIADAADALAAVLTTAGGVTALITSRSILRLYGEHEYPVAPLPLPSSPESLSPEELLAFPAIALFVERSRAVRPGFALDTGNAVAASRICARLDGLPLAIELVAAHSRTFDPPALLSQLTGVLDLSAGLRNVSERQRTMRGAIDWSYQLLTAAGQQLFRVLGVLAGTFGVDEVRGLLGETADGGGLSLLGRLNDLVEMSMIRRVGFSAEPRFGLHTILREYALEQLRAGGELDAYRRAHASYFLALARAKGPRVNLTGGEEDKAALLAANDDLRAAMSWAYERPERVETGLQLALALTDFWIQRGMLAEGQNWLRQGLAGASGEESVLRAGAFIASGRLAYYQAKFAEAVVMGREALALLEESDDEGDSQLKIVAYRVVGNASASLGDYDEALANHQRILEAYRRRGDAVGVAQTLQAMGLTALDMGQFDLAADQLAESVALFRIHGGDTDDLLFSLNGLGTVELVRGHFERARPALVESLDLARQLDTPGWEAMILNNLGHLEIPLGRTDEARQWFADGLRLAMETNAPQYVFQADLGRATLALLFDEPPAVVWSHLRACLDYYQRQGPNPSRFLRLGDVFALFLARSGQPVLAAQLLGRAEAIRRRPFTPPRYANVQPVYDRAVEWINRGLDPDSIAQATRAGSGTPEEELLTRVRQAGQAIARAGLPVAAH